MNSNWSLETLNLCQNWRFFVLCDLEIWLRTLKNNRAPLLSCFKLCASFHSHQLIQTGVTVRKHPIWVKINVFLSHVTLKFDGWPGKIIGHLFYATSSFVHHCVAIDAFKLELQCRNAEFGSNSFLATKSRPFKVQWGMCEMWNRNSKPHVSCGDTIPS